MHVCLVVHVLRKWTVKSITDAFCIQIRTSKFPETPLLALNSMPNPGHDPQRFNVRVPTILQKDQKRGAFPAANLSLSDLVLRKKASRSLIKVSALGWISSFGVDAVRAGSVRGQQATSPFDGKKSAVEICIRPAGRAFST